MTAIRRIASGSAAAWANILVSTIAQVGLVPVYLGHWNIKYYGVWLAVLAIPSALVILTAAYQDFVGYEFLKIGTRDIGKLHAYFSSAVWCSAVVGVMEFLILAAAVRSGGVRLLLGQMDSAGSNIVLEVEFVVILLLIVWAVFGAVGSVCVRVLAPLGYYPRMAWWGVAASAGTALAPAVAVVFGAGIKGAGVTLFWFVCVYNIFMLRDIQKILRSRGFKMQSPNLRVGIEALWKSQILALARLLETVRSSGLRLILLPLAGAGSVASFSTIRTAANVARTGLGTITGPLLPEMMRVVGERDQVRIEAAFGLVWIVLVAGLAPSVVVLQAFVEPLFIVWTRGQMAFDPALFALFSLGVLAFAWAQPAMTIVTGSNMLRVQLTAAFVASATVAVGTIALVPAIGLLGSGAALLAGELYMAYRFRAAAQKLLEKGGVIWPRRSAKLAALSAWIAATSIAVMVVWPEQKTAAMFVALLMLGANAMSFLRSLPDFARARVSSVVARFRLGR